MAVAKTTAVTFFSILNSWELLSSPFAQNSEFEDFIFEIWKTQYRKILR